MKLKSIIVITSLIFSVSLFAASNNATPASQANTVNAQKFVEFNPDNSHSFMVYERDTIVSYNGDEYKAERAINNNSAPANNSAWKKISTTA
ncbi:hypothetical protein OAO18_07350 [Francisellaceae bacterium]|nr:hypothetical protein [Francisellaceae bacterium]